MKKILLPALAGLTMLTFASCDSGKTDETTTDSVVTETSTTSMETSGSTIDMNANYMDLSSGKTFTIDRDTVTTYYVNRETREPVLYYVNVATYDTFDRSGRWINGALIKMDDGTYSVDESRLKVKMDEDGDIKIKGDDGSKIKIDGNEAESKIKTDGSKEKMDGDKYKKKTDTSKIKIKQ
jgi:hypothetical protein